MRSCIYLRSAGRVGVSLDLERFDVIARRTPMLANLRPSGSYLFEDLFRHGGVPVMMRELRSLLDEDALLISGDALVRLSIACATSLTETLSRPLSHPRHPDGGIAVLRGNLAPDGAVIKKSVATPSLLKHAGPAVVFEDINDLDARIDDPDLPVEPGSVLVLRNGGPLGAPGFPEWGMIPIPRKLLEQGVRDMVRISDSRMSGTGFGTVVLHIAPEAAAGGPLAAVRDGDTSASTSRGAGSTSSCRMRR